MGRRVIFAARILHAAGGVTGAEVEITVSVFRSANGSRYGCRGFYAHFDGYNTRSQALKTIRTIVPYAPGGVADIVARFVAEQIGLADGPTVVGENRPGAGGAVGTETVARAAADGNTPLVVSTPFIIDPLLRKLNYDPLTSFEPLCYLVNAPTFIVVSSASPYRTLAQLLDDARAKPGQITMASIGPCQQLSARVRDAQARGEGRHDLCSVSRQRACAQRHIGPAGHVNVRYLFERCGIFEGRNAAGGCRRQSRAHSLCRTFRRLPRRAIGISMPTPDMALSRRRMRPNRLFLGWMVYSKLHLGMRPLRKNLAYRVFIRSAYAVRTLLPI